VVVVTRDATRCGRHVLGVDDRELAHHVGFEGEPKLFDEIREDVGREVVAVLQREVDRVLPQASIAEDPCPDAREFATPPIGDGVHGARRQIAVALGGVHLDRSVRGHALQSPVQRTDGDVGHPEVSSRQLA
jgi:hypothetical protein